MYAPPFTGYAVVLQDLLRQHLFGAVDLRFHRFGRASAQSCSFGHSVLFQQHQTAGSCSMA
jgi:hypothetical protein